MKKTNLKTDSLHTQNMHLYFFGIIFNGLEYIRGMDAQKSFFDVRNFFENSLINNYHFSFFKKIPKSFLQISFQGYNFTTVLVVLAYSFSGLLVSVIMRYADNMIKIYAVAVSMLLTMILSIFLFGFSPSIQLLYGIIIITISILLYFGIIKDTPETLPK